MRFKTYIFMNVSDVEVLFVMKTPRICDMT